MKAALRALALGAMLAAAGHAAADGPALGLSGERLYALPPEAAVRRVLEDLPRLREGALDRELASAERGALAAGPGEWVVTAGTGQRRTYAAPRGEHFREQEVGLERSVRWFGKAEQDRAIGAQGVAVAQARHAEAWHEAGRTLMDDWYEALRARAALHRLEEQHELVRQLKVAAERRVKAGDGAALEALQAETELLRSQALVDAARQELAQAQTVLATLYRDLPAPPAGPLPEPQALPDEGPAGIARLANDNHELALARAEAQWHGLKAQRAASERMPDPTVGFRVARERDGEERTVGLTVSIPLPGAARSAEAGAAAVRARIAGERMAQVNDKVRLAAQRGVAAQRHTQRAWHSLRAIAGQSARQAELMERAYQAGESTLTEALLSRRQALDAALAAQTAQIAALAAAARVQFDAHALWAFD